MEHQKKTELAVVALVVLICAALVGFMIVKKSGSTPAPANKSVTPQKPIPEKNTSAPQQVEAAPDVQEKPIASVDEEKVEFGKSVEGTPLIAYVLGNGNNVTVIFGAFHGNEPSTKTVVLKLRDYLKQHPERVEGKRVILVPVVNPDGLERGKRTNAHNVDINRNFPGTWKKQALKARYSPGPSPASEPETRSVIKLMKKYAPIKVVSIHDPLHTMNYTGDPGQQLAREMSHYNKYPITSDIGYPTPGSFGDYCGKTLGIAIVTLELPNQSPVASWRSNKQALLAAISQ